MTTTDKYRDEAPRAWLSNSETGRSTWYEADVEPLAALLAKREEAGLVKGLAWAADALMGHAAEVAAKERKT